MDMPIIYQDESVLVIHKPAGVVMNKADTTRAVVTVQEHIEQHAASLGFSPQELAYTRSEPLAEGEYDYQEEFALRCGIVHRLDKDTSGVVVIAKHPDVFLFLKNQFKDRQTKKHYTALVHGIIEQQRGEINAPLGRLPWNRTRFGILPDGRSAITQFEKVRSYRREKEAYTLISCFPLTGRTHQIRVHMQYIHHPIVSDVVYAGRKTAREDTTWCPRMFLHASQLTLTHPKTKQVVTYTAPLPEDLRTALAVLTVEE